MSEAQNTADNRWHLDKRIQLPVIAMVISNAIMMGWFAAKMDARVGEQERRIMQLESAQAGAGNKLNELTVGFGRLDERIQSVLAGQNEIKELLSRGRR